MAGFTQKRALDVRRLGWYALAWPVALVVLPITGLVWTAAELAARARAAFRRGDADEMHAKDAVWEPLPPPANQTIITSYLAVESLSLAELRAMVTACLVAALDAHGAPRYPRFTSRIRPRGGGRFAWARAEPEFAIEEHVVLAPAWVCDEASALRRVGELASGDGLRYDRPLWRFELAQSEPGAAAGDDGATSESIVLLQIHHSLADGIALVHILLQMMDAPTLAPLGGPPVAPPATLRRVGAPALRGWSRGLLLLEGPLVALRALLRARASGPLAAVPSGRKLAACAPRIRLADVKAVCRATGCTVNDVLVAAVAAAVRARELELGGGAALPRRIVAVIPINTRPPGSAVLMENELAVVFAALPSTRGRAVLPVLHRTHRELAAIKASVEPHAMAVATRLIHRLVPAPLNRWLVDFGTDRACLMLCTLPGPSEHLAWAGARVRCIRFWSPTRARMCVAASAFSYGEFVELSVMTDAAADAEPGQLCRLFADAFERLHEEACGSEERDEELPPVSSREQTGGPRARRET
ncbi:hypothetical protein KFE25_013029 [Diacronema lutheri]|uniref:Diacylglycerol O-acyltransferase n=1 Tax=Diacronema lutheri TaxID=2081491 RepID=A0A8J5X4T6_DIALT|nr:hypothetical protein KFE25_013029 [Diacronema lutheri]